MTPPSRVLLLELFISHANSPIKRRCLISVSGHTLIEDNIWLPEKGRFGITFPQLNQQTKSFVLKLISWNNVNEGREPTGVV